MLLTAQLNKVDKKGVTLVEVMIALVILLVVFMGLIQASLLTIENTATTALRDEAIRLASDTVTALRAGPFDHLDGNITQPEPPSFRMNSSLPVGNQFRDNADRLHINTVRGSRNLTSIYVVTVSIVSLDDVNKQATVLVNWDWKERKFVNGNPYSHQVVVLLRNRT